MKIFGVDFTSAPRPQKPIVCAVCSLHAARLQVDELLTFASFEGFEGFLRFPAPWVAACDFPFGLPRKLLANLSWSPRWPEYVSYVASLGKTAFEASLLEYQRERLPGDKLHLRQVDALAGAISPMMLYRVPVAKMFFQGAPRLLTSGASILPSFPRPSGRILLEGYPSLLARCYAGRLSYKTDTRSLQTPLQTQTRRQIIAGICSLALQRDYAVALQIPDPILARLEADGSGDSLDAVLCAIQAAWAASRIEGDYGIPEGCDVAEGWIVDPALNPVG
jgi:hypothetical protein